MGMAGGCSIDAAGFVPSAVKTGVIEVGVDGETPSLTGKAGVFGFAFATGTVAGGPCPPEIPTVPTAS